MAPATAQQASGEAAPPATTVSSDAQSPPQTAAPTSAPAARPDGEPPLARSAQPRQPVPPPPGSVGGGSSSSAGVAPPSSAAASVPASPPILPSGLHRAGSGRIGALPGGPGPVPMVSPVVGRPRVAGFPGSAPAPPPPPISFTAGGGLLGGQRQRSLSHGQSPLSSPFGGRARNHVAPYHTANSGVGSGTLAVPFLPNLAANPTTPPCTPVCLPETLPGGGTLPGTPSRARAKAVEHAVEAERARARDLEERERDMDAADLRVALKRERAHSSRLAADLAALWSSAVESQAEAEVHEEGRINGLMRRLDRLQREKGRIIVELEREEEMLTNTLQKKLNEVRREKALLEQQIEREHEAHARLARRQQEAAASRLGVHEPSADAAGGGAAAAGGDGGDGSSGGISSSGSNHASTE